MTHRLAALSASLLLAAACAPGERAAPPPTWDVSKPFVGFSFSPQALTPEGLTEFFDVAATAASLVAWVGPWEELDPDIGAPRTTLELATKQGLTPVIVTGFPSDGQGGRTLPTDDALFLDALSSFIARHPVPYLGVGVEIDTNMWEHDRDDFEWFVAIFPRIVERVHRISPSTVVFPGFQLERLRGLRGGLFGGSNDESADVWELLDRFPDADAIGFTTYPGLIYPDPSMLPDDYYREIRERTDKPIVFTEVGWQAGGDMAEWTGSPEKQAAFVRDWLPELADMGDMVIWSFLWDPDAEAPFATMGLIDGSDLRRPAWDDWLALFS